MARDLNSPMTTAVDEQLVKPAILFQAEFSDGTVRMWTGVGDLSWDSQTWTGAGNFIQLGKIEETTDIKARGVSITLSGIPSSLISTALQSEYQGRFLTIWLMLFDKDTDAIVSDPVILFKGRMDTMEIDEGEETATIFLSAESRLIDFERKRNRRYTNEDQKIDYPNDKGLEFVAAIQDKPIVWKAPK